MRSLAVLLVLVTCGACKEKKQEAPAPATTGAGPAKSATPAPSLPNESAPEASATGSAGVKPSQPMTVEDAAAALPAMPGTQLVGLKPTSDRMQVHGTWCIDGTSAEEVAKHVAQLLMQSSYAGVSVRGDERKAGVVGDRDGIRFSMVVSASSASVCAAPAHYFASATIFRP